MSGPDVVDWRAQSRSFAALAHYRAGETSVTVGNASDYATVVRIGPDFFAAVGATARIGRLLTVDEASPDGPPVAVISDAYWRRQFAGDPGVVGTTLTLDQRTLTIVGVTAPGFRFPARADLYTAEPGRLATAVALGTQLPRGGPAWRTASRSPQARAEMTGIAARLSAEYPRSNARQGRPPHAPAGRHRRRDPADALRPARRGRLRPAHRLRQRRQPAAGPGLGARPRDRRARRGRRRTRPAWSASSSPKAWCWQSAAGIAGALIARVGVTALVALAPPDLPRLDEVTVDASALAFALGISLVGEPGVRPGAGVARLARRPGRRPAPGRQGVGARRARRLGAQGVRRRRDRPRGGPGDGRRAAGAEPRRAGPGRHGLCERAPGRAAYDRAGRRPRGVPARDGRLPRAARRDPRTAGSSVDRRRHRVAERAAIQWQLLDRGRPRSRGADPQRAAGALHRRHAWLLRDARRAGGPRPRRRRRRSARRAVRGGGQRAAGDRRVPGRGPDRPHPARRPRQPDADDHRRRGEERPHPRTRRARCRRRSTFPSSSIRDRRRR